MDRVNDISFEVDGKLVVLIEHQSTINDNMPIRLLLYIARLYEKMLGDSDNIYKVKRIPLPRPQRQTLSALYT
ncbi:MAG: Rpn family recombination-promoting nuclease/putative transposase [Spirochaetaceae bacterium]|nr:Rpn family recombination-promoting nuclease/putative transposase [Spirochaetaceae bacterium]